MIIWIIWIKIYDNADTADTEFSLTHLRVPMPEKQVTAEVSPELSAQVSSEVLPAEAEKQPRALKCGILATMRNRLYLIGLSLSSY